MRRLERVAFVLAYLGAIAAMVGFDRSSSSDSGPGSLVLFTGLAGALVGLAGIRRARDARELCMPRAGSATSRGMFWATVVCCGVPSIILALAIPASAAMFEALVITSAWCAGVLVVTASRRRPRAAFGLAWAFAVLVLPLHAAAQTRWHELVAGGLTIVTGLLALWTLRTWRRMSRADRWNCIATSGWSRGTRSRATGPSTRRSWLYGSVDAIAGAYARVWIPGIPAFPDLSRIGPAFPQRSLRLLLGGPWLPRLRTMRWANHLVLGWLILAVVAFVVGATWSHTPAHVAGWILAGFMVGGTADVLATTGTVLLIHRRWQAGNAELPMLALTPRLLPPTRPHRRVLRTLWQPPMSMSSALLLISLLPAGRVDTWLVVLPVLLHAGCIVCMASASLAVLADRAAHARSWTWPEIALVMLAFFDLVVIQGVADSGAPPGPGVIATMMLLWATYFSMMLLNAWRCWRRWRRSPHPFLAE